MKIIEYNKLEGDYFMNQEKEELKIVSTILADVRKYGDRAVLKYTQKFDGIKLNSTELTKKGIAALSEEILPQNEEKQKILAIIEKLGFSQLTPFDIERKVLEYAFESTHHQ